LYSVREKSEFASDRWLANYGKYWMTFALLVIHM